MSTNTKNKYGSPTLGSFIPKTKNAPTQTATGTFIDFGHASTGSAGETRQGWNTGLPTTGNASISMGSNLSSIGVGDALTYYDNTADELKERNKNFLPMEAVKKLGSLTIPVVQTLYKLENFKTYVSSVTDGDLDRLNPKTLQLVLFKLKQEIRDLSKHLDDQILKYDPNIPRQRDSEENSQQKIESFEKSLKL